MQRALLGSLDKVMTIDELPKLIDRYVATRAERLALQKDADEKQKRENELKGQIEKLLTENGLNTGGGTHFRATIVPDFKPTVDDWGALHRYIAQTGEWDLLQRRVGEVAVKERWEEGIEIPGVQKFPVTKLSITKV
jgi:hypothetical protein